MKSGNKAVLVQFLIAAANNPEPDAVNASGNAALTQPHHESKDLEAVDPSAWWRVLMHKDTPCTEPQRLSHRRGHTITDDEKDYCKLDFKESLDRPLLTGMPKAVKLGAKGQPLKGKICEICCKSEVRTAGKVNLEWMRMHGLTENRTHMNG